LEGLPSPISVSVGNRIHQIKGSIGACGSGNMLGKGRAVLARGERERERERERETLTLRYQVSCCPGGCCLWGAYCFWACENVLPQKGQGTFSVFAKT